MRTILSGGSLVLPHEVREGSLVIEDGVIAEITERRYPAAAQNGEQVIDVAGRLVLPGLIDLHNDAIEREISPRPGAQLPLPFALSVLDRRLISSGVTTEFNAVYFADVVRSERRLVEAPERAIATLEFGAGDQALVRHHVLFRIDLWSPEGFAAALRASEAAVTPLFSLNDHTPGQGQYRDVEQFKRFYSEQLGRTKDEVEQEVLRQIERAQDEREVRLGILRGVRSDVAARGLFLASHDDDTPERVDEMYAVGARIGEFPVTLAAARRQRELGMQITAGAPNVVRGGSASGNIAAGELLAHGLVDILCADYHAPSLLMAVLGIAAGGIMPLPQAVRLVTLNPATAVGLGGTTGSLEPGKQADIAVIDTTGPVPAAELVYRGGTLIYFARAGSRSTLPAWTQPAAATLATG